MNVYGTKEKHGSSQLPGVKERMKIRKTKKTKKTSQHLSTTIRATILVSFSRGGGSRSQRTAFPAGGRARSGPREPVLKGWIMFSLVGLG